MPKALRSGSSTGLVLGQALAARLGIGTWCYCPEQGRLTITGCLAVHLSGIDRVELPLESLLDRLPGETADELKAALRRAAAINCFTCRVGGHNGTAAWFRLLGDGRTSGCVQRLANGEGPDRSPLDGRH